VDNTAEDEEDALTQAKRFLSYLPSNVWEMPPTNYEKTTIHGEGKKS